jgi:hypothetical protein
MSIKYNITNLPPRLGLLSLVLIFCLFSHSASAVYDNDVCKNDPQFNYNEFIKDNPQYYIDLISKLRYHYWEDAVEKYGKFCLDQSRETVLDGFLPSPHQQAWKDAATDPKKHNPNRFQYIVHSVSPIFGDYVTKATSIEKLGAALSNELISASFINQNMMISPFTGRLATFRPLIFLGQSKHIDCVTREGEKDDCRSEAIFEGAA